MKESSEVCRVLAETLASEVSSLGEEQVYFLLQKRSGAKALVLVAATDTAVGRVLEFLDHQHESGVTRRVASWPEDPAP